MSLIASWSPEQDASVDSPTSILWSDGRSASLAEYQDHFDNTYLYSVRADGSAVQRMFPDITADVRYDQIAGTWVVTGEGVEPFGLDLIDPRAKDDQIIAELSTYPVVYRARIHR